MKASLKRDEARESVRELMERGVKERVFSGAQAAWIVPEGHPVFISAGTTRPGGGKRISPDTLFDVASLTKIWTFSAALRLVAEGRLSLGEPVSRYLEELGTGPLWAFTLEQLLAHEGGFQAWLPLFEQIPLSDRGTRGAREKMIRLVIQSDPHNAMGPGAVYSDLGYMALGLLLERVTDTSLERVIDEQVNRPLCLKNVAFRPVGGVSSGAENDFAATENCPWRGRVLLGEVHDDNAWTMGGVAGHAGLFANAEQVARLGAAWLETLGSGEWLPRDLARRAVTPRGTGRALGWDLKSAEGSSAGVWFGPRSFGHLGFTGCSLWVDPDQSLTAVLLTNRVCYGRENLKIRRFRRTFHDLLAADEWETNREGSP